jgi:hypothetical protein
MYEYTYQSRCATRQSSSRQLEVGAHIERGTFSDDPEVRSSNETICEYSFDVHVVFLGTDNVQLIGSLATIPRASLHASRVTRVMPPTSHSRPRRRLASLMEFTIVRPRM